MDNISIYLVVNLLQCTRCEHNPFLFFFFPCTNLVILRYMYMYVCKDGMMRDSKPLEQKWGIQYST